MKAFAYLPRTAGPTPVPAEARRDGHWEVDVVLPGDACVIDVHAPAPIGAYLSGVAMTVMTTWRAAAGVSTHTFLSLVPVKHPGGGSWDCGSVQLRLGPMVAESIAHWASLSTP